MAQVSAFFAKVLAYLFVVVTPFTSLFGMTYGGLEKTHVKQDEVLLSAVALSDTHIKSMLYRTLILDMGMNDISGKINPDLLLVTGDCTDNGNEKNWEAFQKCLAKSAVKNKIVTMGNHDTWTSYDTPHDYTPALENYLKYSNAIMGTDHDKVYFTYEVNGYHFIVLGSDDTSTSATISDEQFAWADNALAEAAADSKGKPIFVILHQPLNFTHAVGDNEHSHGIDSEDSAQLQAIMDKYENVFYFSGHQHYGLTGVDEANLMVDGFKTIEQVGENITSVNLPSYEYGSFLSGGEPLIGQGLLINVYADRVEFLGRNFALGGWIPTFNVSIPLK